MSQREVVAAVRANGAPMTSREVAEAVRGPGTQPGVINRSLQAAVRWGDLVITGRRGRAYLYDVPAEEKDD